MKIDAIDCENLSVDYKIKCLGVSLITVWLVLVFNHCKNIVDKNEQHHIALILPSNKYVYVKFFSFFLPSHFFSHTTNLLLWYDTIKKI